MKCRNTCNYGNLKHFRQTDHEGNPVGKFLNPLGISDDNLKSNPGDSNVHAGGGAHRVAIRVLK